MKQGITLFLMVLIGLTAWGQKPRVQSLEPNSSQIKFRSVDRAQCTEEGYRSLKATFSFASVTSHDTLTERGVFSTITMANTVAGGNEGEPMLPVVNELIALPMGAHPVVSVKSYSTTDYRLDDYAITTIFPRQASLRKDLDGKDVPFAYDERAYQTRSLASEPRATVSVEGNMRGIRLGKLGIEPVSYDPVSNTLRVFNDIEVEVRFDGADEMATRDMLLKSFSPYFMGLYKMMFNGKAILSAYDDHPDLYHTPARMMVVTTAAYAAEAKFEEWVNWKQQKGIAVDVYTTDQTGTSSSNIKSFISTKYYEGLSAGQAPSFVVIVGDVADVNYSDWSNFTEHCTDLYYASVDGDVFPEMFCSRMSVSSAAELGNLVDKTLTYEQYTMADPTYLNNALLVAGWDAYMTAIVGRPTIEYALEYYYNTAHGFGNVYSTLTYGTGQIGQYSAMSSGVGFANYTAHGGETGWTDPSFSVYEANSLTNNDKYFWALGNCCLSGDWGYSVPCLGEALLRGQNKGAFGYIGSCPLTYWYEDYFFAVGANHVTERMPAMEETQRGFYDAIWDDDAFNTLNAVPYFGNVAVTYSHANGYMSAVTDRYYWEAYHCLGDGSVMPYHVNPIANVVSHSDILPLGANSFTVQAHAGSYVALTKDNVILGVALVDNTGSVDVPITPVMEPGNVKLVVTRQQRQPYITTLAATGGEQCLISATASPQEGGVVTGAGNLYVGTIANLTATPNLGYEFVNWTEDDVVVSTSATYSFTITEARSLVAHFSQMTRGNITYATPQHGIINGPAAVYPRQEVSLVAYPDAGYQHGSWTVSKTGQPYITVPVTNNSFVMPNYDVTVNATFVQPHGYAITLPCDMEYGVLTADHSFAEEGTVVTLTPTPAPHCQFNNVVVFNTADPEELVFVNPSDMSFEMPAFDVTVSASFTMDGNTVGTGGTTNQYLPTMPYYKYNLTQQIYTAGEVGGEAGNIYSLSFIYLGESTQRQLDIYLTNISESSFETTAFVPVSTADLVYSGYVTLESEDWTTVVFDTPFAYSGGHLMLTVDDNTGSYVFNYGAFQVNYTTNTRALCYFNDNNNPNPLNPTEEPNDWYSRNNYLKFGFSADSGNGTLVATPCELADFSYFVGEGPSEAQRVNVVGNNLAAPMEVTVPNAYELSTNPEGPYTTSLNLFGRHQTRDNETTYDFEDGFQGWTTIDADRDGFNWSICSVLHGNSNWGHYGGDCLTSLSYAGNALTPDNYLVSPLMVFGEGASITFWACAQDANFPFEHFGVAVSLGSNSNASDFTTIREWTIGSKGDGGHGGQRGTRSQTNWTQYTVDLSDFTGQGYVAIRHFGCTDNFALDVDDVTITQNSSGPTAVLPEGTQIGQFYVRMKAGLAEGQYADTPLTLSSGSTTAELALNGRVTTPLHIVADTQTIEGNLLLGSNNRYVVTATGNLTVDGTLTSLNNAWIVVNDGGQLNSNSALVKGTYCKNIAKATSDADGWYAIAMPVSNASISGLTSNTYDLYAYDEDADLEEWRNYRQNQFAIVPGQGYLYANGAAAGQESTQITMTGNLVPSCQTIAIPLSYDAQYAGIRGFNFIGNPYTRNLTMSELKIDGQPVTEYYRLMNGTTLVRFTSGDIPTGEAFFIKATAAGQVLTIGQ